MVAVLFTTPLAAGLTLAAAASIPVIIHLLNRRRHRTVDWAAMRFLLAAQRQNVRRLRLEQWLLLALRSAVLVLLGLAIAAVTPWAESLWQRWWPSGARAAPAGRTHKVLVLDASLSMAARDGGASAFERGQRLAANLVRSSAGGDAFSVIVMSGSARAIVPGPADDAAKVAEAIEELHCSHGAADLNGALLLAEELIRKSPGKFSQREVYVVSDLQRGTWQPPASPAGAWTEPWSRLLAAAQVVVLDVGRDDLDNLAVTDVTMSDPVAVVGLPNALSATIRNASARPRTGIRVELSVARGAEEPVVVQQETIAVPAVGTATVGFPLQVATPGDFLFRVRLPDDALDADNSRALIVHVRDRLPVALVNGKLSADRRAQAASWLADALNPFGDDAPRPLVPARPTTFDLAQFADPGAGNLEPFDAVFLCDVPRLSEREIARLDAHLQRGGGLVIGLGPNVDFGSYNRLLGPQGRGWLPGPLVSVVRAPEDRWFTLAADAESWRRPPLAAFASDNDRAALLGARIRQYVRIEPLAANARKRLTLVPPAGTPDAAARAVLADALMIENDLPRGRVVVLTTTWNTDWTSWPIAPSFPPFVQELLRTVVRNGIRRTVVVHEPLAEWLSTAVPGGTARLELPDGRREAVTLSAEPDATRFEFAETDLSGVYRLDLSQPSSAILFVVNPAAGVESDLRRLGADELRAMAPVSDVQVVTSLDQIRRPSRPAAPADAGEPIRNSDYGSPVSDFGLRVARGLVWLVLLGLALESVLAWRFGSARSRQESRSPESGERRRWVDRLAWLLVLLVGVVTAVAGFVAIHAAVTGELLGFLPDEWRGRVEAAFGVPSAAPGEGTRWRLEFLPNITGHPINDRWLLAGLGAAAIALAILIYRREARSGSRWIAPLAVLRMMALAVVIGVLLPQVRLLFERQGRPDFAIVIDDSASMATVDPGLPAPAESRLARVQRLLAEQNAAWLESLIASRQLHVRVYRASDRIERIADFDGATDAGDGLAAIAALKPVAPESRLGNAVETVLQEYRGSSLGGIVIFTDGVTTDGPDLGAAGRSAARAGVPLFPVGVGAVYDPPDLILHDLQCDDVVHVNDRIVFEARLSARGDLRAAAVPVTLFEKLGDSWKPLRTETVAVDASGQPARVRLTYTPTQPGERRFALEVSKQPEESDESNNRIERSILVTDAQRTRILYIEGYPRYEYRFLKTLLERESDSAPGNKTVELSVLLCDADADASRQDRSAIDALPASRDELFRRYDLIILGDVDPRHPKLGEKHLQWIAEFVAEKGGGLLAIAGPQFLPAAYRDSPLATTLPIDLAVGRVRGDGAEPFRLRLTPLGAAHPVFRLAPDDAENHATWQRLMPLYWSAGEYRLKPAAEALAERPAAGDGAPEPIAIQQFVGAGRVLYFGFDESWRWRRREDEWLFNRFWMQTVRFLSRSRLGRCDLRVDRQSPYRAGEPIRVTARFPDDAPPPPTDAPVQVAVDARSTTGETERQVLQLNRVPGSRATFEALLLRTMPGQYQFRLQSPASAGPPPTALARVLPPPGELDRLQLDQGDLERAAHASRGRYFPLAEAGRLPLELPEIPRIALHQPRPPYELWSHPALWAWIVGLMTFEWLWRKRRRLL